MKVHKTALPRTDLTVKRFLADLSDPRHAVRTLTFVADVRMARMYWPEKVTYSDDIQAPGWTSHRFKPFSNLSHAVDLVRHAVRNPRLSIEVGADTTRVMLFSQTLQAGACGEDERPEYAVCKAFLNSRLLLDGAMYGYVLGMGLAQAGYEAPRIGMEEVADHHRSGDIRRDGLGKGSLEPA